MDTMPNVGDLVMFRDSELGIVTAVENADRVEVMSGNGLRRSERPENLRPQHLWASQAQVNFREIMVEEPGTQAFKAFNYSVWRGGTPVIECRPDPTWDEAREMAKLVARLLNKHAGGT